MSSTVTPVRSIFDELAELDRPFVPFNLEIARKLYPVKARRPNAAESDVIESLYDDEYAKALVRLTESEEGRVCELEQVRTIYKSVPTTDIINQLMNTRTADIQRLAFERTHFDISDEAALLASLETEDERKQYIEEKQAKIKEAFEAARQEVRAEYEEKSAEELAELISQVNINVKAIRCARQAQESHFMYFTLYDVDENKVCPSIEKIREKYTTETVSSIVEQINRAFMSQSSPDLPFVSPEDNAHNGQPLSPGTSEADTKTGGTRTKTTRGNSKRSTTPASGTSRKKT